MRAEVAAVALRVSVKALRGFAGQRLSEAFLEKRYQRKIKPWCHRAGGKKRLGIQARRASEWIFMLYWRFIDW